MQDINIEISPITINGFYFCYTDSYRFGVTQGTIYTPRFFNRVESDDFENNGEIKRRVSASIVHEVLHKLIFELEGYECAKQFDNIAKNADNTEYLI